MLSHLYRLPARYKLSHPKTISSPLFILKYAPSPSLNSRCSVVISKNVDKRATMRNKLRRTIHSTLQTKLKEMTSPYDLLFVLKKEVLTMNKEQIENQVLESLKKVETA